MDQPTGAAFTAYVGIDWADTKHDVCIESGIEGEREFAVIPHQAKDINDWVQSLLHRFGKPIAVAVELSKGPIVYALQKYDGLIIFPVISAGLSTPITCSRVGATSARIPSSTVV